MTRPDVRAQLREVTLCLDKRDLQQAAVLSAESLLRNASAEDVQAFFRLLFSRLNERTATTRRLRYKLGAYALRAHAARSWGLTLLFIRDRIVERVGCEDQPQAAAELQALVQALTAACLECFIRSEYAALGVSSRAELAREWLSSLLIAPLLLAACRGPARAKVANGCLLAYGVLLELQQRRHEQHMAEAVQGCKEQHHQRATESSVALHAAADCLKQMLKLKRAGVLPLICAEALLPLQGCVALLGPRLRPAAVEGIVALCTQAMQQQRGEWQVRRAAAETLSALVVAVQQQRQPGSPAHARAPTAATAARAADVSQQAGAGGEGGSGSGREAVEDLRPSVEEAVARHLKYDRVPQVRQAAQALLQELQAMSCRAGAPAEPALASKPLAQAAAAGKRPSAPSPPKPWQQSPALKRSNGTDATAVVIPAGMQSPMRASQSATSQGSRQPAGGPAEQHQAATQDGLLEACGSTEDQACAQPRSPAAGGFHSPRQLRQQQRREASPQRKFARPTLRELNPDALLPVRSSLDFGVQVYAPLHPTAPARELQQLAVQREAAEAGWRDNPLAAAAAAGAAAASAFVNASQWQPGAAPPPAAAVTAAATGSPRVQPVSHHISQPAFRLTLQSSPAQAAIELCDSSSGTAATPAAGDGLGGRVTGNNNSVEKVASCAVLSVRVWTSSTGSECPGEVGAEVWLAGATTAETVICRYWLDHGQLVEEQQVQRRDQPPQQQQRQAPDLPQSTAGSPDVRSSWAAEPAAAAGAKPALQQVHEAQSPHKAPLPPQQQPQQEAAPAQQAKPLASISEAGLAAGESPLLFLAAGALPSFSLPGSPVQGATLCTAAAGQAAAAGAATMAWVIPAGVRSESSTHQHSPATNSWTASLRPPEQLSWGSQERWHHVSSRGSSRAASPSRQSRPGEDGVPNSPQLVLQESGPGSSRAAAPSRHSSPERYRNMDRSGSAETANSQQQQQQAALPGSGPAKQVSLPLQEQQQQPCASPPPPQMCASPPHTPAAPLAAATEEQVLLDASGSEAGAGAPAGGALTQMVVKAVGRLQQLQELQDLVGDVDTRTSSVEPTFGGVWHSSGSRSQAQRSAEPSLSSIAELRTGEPDSAAAGALAAPDQHNNTDNAAAVREALRQRRQQQQAAQQEAQGARQQQHQAGSELQRLQRLQEQLEASMAEINHKLAGQQLPGSPARSVPSSPTQVAPVSPNRAPARQLPQTADAALGAGNMAAGPSSGGSTPVSKMRAQAGDRTPAAADMQPDQQETPASVASLAISSDGRYDAAFPTSASAGDSRSRELRNPLFTGSRPSTASPLASQAHAATAASVAPGLRGSVAMSLGSLGSGFGGQAEGEEEVLQFLRGSIAHAHLSQAGAGAGAASVRSSLQQQQGGSRLRVSTAAPLQAAPEAKPQQLHGSIDLAAILDSRPASPDEKPPGNRAKEAAALWAILEDSSISSSWEGDADGARINGQSAVEEHAHEQEALRVEHGPWQASPTSSSGQRQAAVAEQRLLHISSRSPSPTRRLTASGASTAAGGGASSASVSGVLEETFPEEAVARLELLKAPLASGETSAGGNSNSAQQAQASSTSGSGSQQTSSSASGARSSVGMAQLAAQPLPGFDLSASEDEIVRHASTKGSPDVDVRVSRSQRADSARSSVAAAAPLSGAAASPSSSPQAPRLIAASSSSPDLGHGLPTGVTRYGARLLQRAVGRMAGNAGEGADASDLQAALMDVLEQHSAQVQQRYQEAGHERLEGLRQEYAYDLSLMQQVLEREGAHLAAAQEAGIRQELAAFVEGTLPALAAVLESRELLLRCFQLLDDAEEESEG